MPVTVSWRNSTPSMSMLLYGSRISSADCRPSITSSLEKPKTNESLRSSSVTRTASASVSDSRFASSRPPNPAPRMRTCFFIGTADPIRSAQRSNG